MLSLNMESSFTPDFVLRKKRNCRWSFATGRTFHILPLRRTTAVQPGSVGVHHPSFCKDDCSLGRFSVQFGRDRDGGCSCVPLGLVTCPNEESSVCKLVDIKASAIVAFIRMVLRGYLIFKNTSFIRNIFPSTGLCCTILNSKWKEKRYYFTLSQAL